MKIWRKVETTECRESPQKTVRRAVDAPSRGKKNHNSDDYKVKNTTEIYVSIGTRTKKHSLDPLEGKNPKSRLCRQRYARKQAREECSTLGKRITVDQADHENRRRQIVR